ncbi:unnamed protein product [Ambrosiozyma monospora]|uniref:Unnamed protein product n=1 Tax=Ambrosiozyma monospora TaxID=43982 RepID=A0ACB5TZ58_AMBMO|nr:unnamed protein product [Ambrosiozyma monospora]
MPKTATLTPAQSTLDEDERQSIENLFIAYSTRAVQVLETCFKNINKLNDKQNKISMKTGKLLEDIELRVEGLNKLFEKFSTFCEYACDLFSLDKPHLEKEASEEEQTKVTLVTNSGTDTIWENEDDRKFYRDVPSLETMISAETLAGGKSEGDKTTTESTSGETEDETAGSKMTELLVRLDSATTGRDVDERVKRQ